MYLVYYFMSTCAREAAIVLPYRCALMQTGTELLRGKRSLKIDRSVKMYESCTLQVMGS